MADKGGRGGGGLDPPPILADIICEKPPRENGLAITFTWPNEP